MTFDPHRDDACRGMRQPSILCGDAVLDLDSHGPRERSCGAATLQQSVTAPERWNMGPALHDADVAMDQRRRIPSTRCSPVISWRSVVHVGATDDLFNRAFHRRLAEHGMSFGLQRDDDRRGVRQPSILCGDAVLDLDSHGPRERSCGAATLQRSMTAPERWNMGPTLTPPTSPWTNGRGFHGRTVHS